MSCCNCSHGTPFTHVCGPSILHRANNKKWKNCPMRIDTAFWYIKYDADLRMTLEVYIEEAYRFYMENNFRLRSPDVAWVDEKNRSAGGVRLSSAFTVLGREGNIITSKFTIKMFSLLRNFIIVNVKLTDKSDVNTLIKLWVVYRRNEEFAEEERWREHMSALLR